MNVNVDVDQPRLETVGVRPLTPTYFWDFDHTGLTTVNLFARENFSDWDIYESSPNRYHLVAACPNWDVVQAKLRITAEEFPNEHYVQHCRRLRLRIAPVWRNVEHLGHELVKPAPVLLTCGCPSLHREKRIGREEKYTIPDRERSRRKPV